MWETHSDLKPTIEAAWEANGQNLSVGEVRTNLEALSRNLGEWAQTILVASGEKSGVLKRNWIGYAVMSGGRGRPMRKSKLMIA